MEKISNKIKLILTLSLTILSTMLFSMVAVLAATNILINNTIKIEYINPQVLVTGQEFGDTIFDVTEGWFVEIIFDYASEHTDIIDNYEGVPINVAGKYLDEGGVCMYYDYVNYYVYILCNDLIYANENSSNMFKNFYDLEMITFNNLDTSMVINMGQMFERCSSLVSLDLSCFDTSNVTTTTNMFRNCSSLKTIYVGHKWTMEKLLLNDSENNQNGSNDMFYGCSKLVGQNGSTISTVVNDNRLKAVYAKVDGGVNDPGYLTGKGTVYLNTIWRDVLNSVLGVSSDQITSINFCNTAPSGQLNSVSIGSDSSNNVTTLSSLAVAYSSSDKKTIHIMTATEKLKTPANSTGLFKDLTSLQEINNINLLDTSDTTNMFEMFENCTSLKSLDVSGFNTDKVTRVSQMFYYCSSLTNLTLGNFKAEGDLQWMFAYCSSLTSLDLSGFNTSNATQFYSMFYKCEGLQSLDLSKLDAQKVINTSHMFDFCIELTAIKLSGWKTSSLRTCDYMFRGCVKLVYIYIDNDWSTANVTSSTNMFLNCTSLSGSAGTTYNSNRTNATYARLDRGTSSPGYFRYQAK